MWGVAVRGFGLVGFGGVGFWKVGIWGLGSGGEVGENSGGVGRLGSRVKESGLKKLRSENEVGGVGFGVCGGVGGQRSWWGLGCLGL